MATKNTTKEKIFNVALDLFSQKGFDAVTVREIAREVGIVEGSIYNHYKNKEAILDAIIDYLMAELHKVGPSEVDMDALMDQGIEVFFEFSTKMFIERMNTPTMEKIWRLVSIELYHNEKIRTFYKEEILEDPLNNWEINFAKMIEKGIIKPFNPSALAQEYLSFMIFLFFEYFVLKYDEDTSFTDLGLEKMNTHTEFLLKVIKA